MHLLIASETLAMSDRPKLVYAVALPLVSYVVLTAFWVDWHSLEGTQLFAITKHLVVLLPLVMSLFFFLHVGCWATLAWSAVVPFERYVALFQELSAVMSGADFSLAAVDVIRILLVLAACLLSGALVFVVHFRAASSSSVRADA
jgi:hypothetical protein